MTLVEWIKVNKINFIFLSEWGLYLIFEFVMGTFKSWDVFLINLLPFIFFYLVANLLKWLAYKIGKVLRVRLLILGTTSLVLCDLLVKYIIKSFVAEGSIIPLISNWLFISNVLNDHGSYITSRFDFNVSMIWLVIINMLILFFMFQGYRFYKLKRRKSVWLDLTMMLLVAGGISSLIDKVFFGGSLDFLGLKGLFVADLKDLYLTIGIGCMIVEVVDNPETDVKRGTTQKDIQLIKDFLKFCIGVKKRKKEINE